MAVRKRKWTNGTGDHEAWVVNYHDTQRARRQKTFDKKRDADAFAAQTAVQVRDGSHVADRASLTVKQAGDQWLEACEADGLERTTLAQYRQHLSLHIVPYLGAKLLSRLTPPDVRAYEDGLRKDGRSPAMVKRALGSLGALLADAQERGQVSRNVVRDLRGSRRRGKERQGELRQRELPLVGRDIPTREEIKAIVDAAVGRWHPLLSTAAFTGLRASELRGLRWQDVDLDGRYIYVRQRADRFNDFGPPKSASGRRRVPLSRPAADRLRAWKSICPKGDLDLVFPNGRGNAESLANIVKRGWHTAQIAAGVTVGAGETLKAKYPGLHSLRHFYVSWCINTKDDGGQGLQAKAVQERIGHSSITMTFDIYGHLFPRGDDHEALDAAELALMA